MASVVIHSLSFGQALKWKVKSDERPESKHMAVITRLEWVKEDESYARVRVNPNGSITISRIRKNKRGKNYLTVEDYAANDWIVRYVNS